MVDLNAVIGISVVALIYTFLFREVENAALKLGFLFMSLINTLLLLWYLFMSQDIGGLVLLTNLTFVLSLIVGLLTSLVLKGWLRGKEG